jgi:response regulator RpfG family c-di-GMP phosphodiesterase
VVIAYEGHEGFISILKGIPHFVLCEIDSTHMSGLEILARSSELLPHHKHVPFAFLTAQPDRESELKARQLGAGDYIAKPVDFDILPPGLRRCLTMECPTRLTTSIFIPRRSWSPTAWTSGAASGATSSR